MGMFSHMFSPNFSDSKEGEDFYINEDGLRVNTELFLAKRGHCCSNGCKHCPYHPKHQKGNPNLREDVAKRLKLK